MNYSPDDFLLMMDEVERQGGSHSPDRCVPRPYKIKLPAPGNKSGMKWRELATTGCHNESIFLVPYDTSKPVTVKHKGESTTDQPTEQERATMNERGAGLARVCAVDDSMGLWPRFANVIKEG